MSHYLLVAVAASVLTSACGESVEEYLAKHRASATGQLQRVDRIRQLARDIPPVEWPTMEDPGPMAICDLVIAPYRKAGCDTWVIDQEQLDNPETFLDPTPLVSFGHADWLVTTRSLLTTGRYPPNATFPDGDEPDRLTRPIIYAFSWLSQLRYLIVVRRSELVRPKLAEDQKSYEPGSYQGEALLFALSPDPIHLGSVPFSYRMVGDVKVRMRRGHIHASQVERAFAQGVREELAAALVSRLESLERPGK